MRHFLFAALFGAWICVPAPALAERRPLSDQELEEVTAGTDLCALFGISGSCAISYVDVVNSPTSFNNIIVSPVPDTFSTSFTCAQSDCGASITQNFSVSNTTVSQSNVISFKKKKW